MADAVANLENGLQQTFPFMKLPPELRLAVYELAIRSHLEDVERNKSLQCGPPGIGVSLKSGNRMRETRTLEVAELERRKKSKAAPYLGALALLHTSRMVYWESYNAMSDIAKRYMSARHDTFIKVWRCMSQAGLDGDMQRKNLHHGVFEEMYAALPFVAMGRESLDNTFPRYLENFGSILEYGNLRGKVKRSALSITKIGGSARSAAGVYQDAALADAVKYFPGICGKIQKRLEGGAGVRTSFKAEVKKRVKWKITDEDVAIMIDGITALGHALETTRGPDPSNRLRSFRVVKHKSRPKRRRSKISCDPPKTWLSTDEMDTGP